MVDLRLTAFLCLQFQLGPQQHLGLLLIYVMLYFQTIPAVSRKLYQPKIIYMLNSGVLLSVIFLRVEVKWRTIKPQEQGNFPRPGP